MIAKIRSLVDDVIQSRSLRLRLFGFLLLACIAVYFGFFAFSAKDSVSFIKHTGYYFMLAAVVATGVESYLFCRRNWGELHPWLRHHYAWPFWATLVPLTLFLWMIQDVGFKVLMDEINLLGTSMCLHLDKQAYTVLRGYELGGVFLPLDGFIDKRPLLFPFLLSIMHDLTGYRPENAFYFNLALTPVALSLCYTLGVLLSGARGGVLAMLLLACFPMFNQCAHGGGFEALNLVMILSAMLCACLYLRRPEPGSLSVFCLSAVLLANVRYESVLFVGPVAIIVILGWLRAEKVLLSRGLFYAPILLLPIPMLHRIFEVNPAFAWQLTSKSADSPFGLEFFFRNLGQAISMFFSLNHSQPVSVGLSVFGVVGCALFLVLLLREARKPERISAELVALAWMGVGILALAGLLMLYFWDFDDVATRRLGLPIVILLIFPGIAALGRLFPSRPVISGMIALAVLILLIEVAPRSSKDIYQKEYYPANFTAWKRQFIKDHAGEYNLMIDTPGLWVTHEVPAILHNTAVEKKGLLKFHLQNRTFDNIYLVETFTKDIATGKLRGKPYIQLDDDFVLETVAEKTFNDVVYLRISRVTDIQVETPEGLWTDYDESYDDYMSRTDLQAHVREQQRLLARLLP